MFIVLLIILLGILFGILFEILFMNPFGIMFVTFHMTTLNNALRNINTSVWVSVAQKVWWVTSDNFTQPGNIWNSVSVTIMNPFVSLGLYQPIADLAAAKTYDT